MNRLELGRLSATHDVRRLTMDDVDMILAFCRRQRLYYQYCGKEPSAGLIRQDLQLAPPGIPMEQKYYIGFFEENRLAAIMDLIAGYPDDDTAFIGFFMVASDLQGKGVGSGIVAQVLAYLKAQGFLRCRLGIDKENPQSRHFWKKNGFGVIREVQQEEGSILLAERQL